MAALGLVVGGDTVGVAARGVAATILLHRDQLEQVAAQVALGQACLLDWACVWCDVVAWATRGTQERRGGRTDRVVW